MTNLETPRLILRDWNEGDLDPFIQMNQDAMVMKYFPNILKREETMNLYKRIIAHCDKWGYGLYAAEYKPDNKFIGFIGLSHPRFESDFTPCVEIGWRLDKQYWRQGLATEGATEVLRYAFSDLGLKEVYSFTAIKNIPSFRVMEKIGLNRIGPFYHPNLPRESAVSLHWIYKITKNEFRVQN